MEIARGTTGDRPWPELFATLAFAGEICELVVEVGAQVHRVAFADHAVIAASSPLAADSALRLMLTSGIITPQMTPMVAARVAAAPNTDPIDVLAAVAQLPPETTLLIRRRAIAVAATRVFALAHGSYHASHELTLQVRPGAAIDVRALIYEGVRTRLSDEQLAEAVARHGTSFVLRPEIWDDLPQFGFSLAEQPLVDELRGGASLVDLALRYPELGARGVHAVAMALLAARALDPMPQLPRASNQYAAQPLARASDQLPAQRTTGQFSTQAPVTGRFAVRTTGAFDAPAPHEHAEPPARTTASHRAASPAGTYELAEQPRSRSSATFAAVEPPHDDAAPPRSFTTRPPVTGAFRTTGEFSVTLRPARPTTSDPLVDDLAPAKK